MLLDLSPVTQVQADLFDARDRAREAWLMRALDSLNADYGARTVRVGNVGGNTPGLGDAPGVPQPALYDALAGVAGGAVVIPSPLNLYARGGIVYGKNAMYQPLTDRKN